ncbi:MAG: hypothetical protein JWM59_3560 [Verrucomicrobiales bacterium]|nr:hypothetical protein [Verrucomicrobiales bacterium]
MGDPVVSTTAGAFMVGLLTSAHCSIMCGPLLCAALPRPSPAYHAGRVVAYTTLGAAAGALGKPPLQLLSHSPAALLPWVLVLLLGSILLGWKPALPKPRFLQRLAMRARLQQSTAARGLITGLLTPLLPCGPLYLVLAACLVSASAASGARFALAFTLGTIPLLWISQAGWGRLNQSLSAARMRMLQRSMAGLALLMVLWRLIPSGSLSGSTTEAAKVDSVPSCPLCTLPATVSASTP